MNADQRRSLGLQRGQGRLLVIEPYRLLPLLPRIAPFGQQVIVQPTARFQLRLEEALLLWG
jgi:hypothetical protein